MSEQMKIPAGKFSVPIESLNQYLKQKIHYYPQYRFICNNNSELININIKRIEPPKKYDLKKYYDEDTLKKVNKVYMRDFELLNYKMYNTII